MKKIKILFITGMLSSLYANSYTEGKQYTYNEVSEILSEKIIETKKRVEESRLNSLKEYEEVRSKLNILTEKVNQIEKNQKTQTQTQTKMKNENNNKEKIAKETEVKNTEIEEIIIDKEMLEKAN